MQKKKLRNKFERKLDGQLKRSGVPYSYESERIPYIIKGWYTPDFIIQSSSGRVYIEAKGYLRPEHRRKMVSVKTVNPEIDIRFVFYSLRPSYTRWADKHGFPWAIGKIPKEWLA